MKKICKICKKTKDRAEFPKKGLRCKQCKSIYMKEYCRINKDSLRERNKKYRKANPELANKWQREKYHRHKEAYREYARKWWAKTVKERPWLRTYCSIRSRCKHHPSYVKRAIKNLITIDEVKKLWFRDKAWLLKKPSIDRIDTYGHYSFANCRYIECIKNCQRPRAKKKLLKLYKEGQNEQSR